MRIVLAPDSYKGSLSALEAANSMEKGILALLPHAVVEKVPMADGGEGTVDALLAGAGGKKYFLKVTGPLGEPVQAFYGILLDGTAVIEMAAASGLTLVPKGQRNPLCTTTFGTGELIKAVLDQGCTRIIIGIGGSATNDGGVGMAQALGVSFLDGAGKELGFGGGQLAKLKNIGLDNLDARIKETEILVACDVDNPLIGPFGASRVFGPQKGADSRVVAELELGLINLAEVVEKDLGMKIRQVPGGGAAGGLGAGLLVFLKAKLISGFTMIAEATDLEGKITRADLVITGEGKTDAQTAHGKAPMGVGKLAKKHGVIAVAISGSLEGDLSKLYEVGLIGLFSITPGPMTLECAMTEAPTLLRNATSNVVRLLVESRNFLHCHPERSEGSPPKKYPKGLKL